LPPKNSKIVYLETYLEEECLIKERFRKEYRHPVMDERLTKKRIQSEAKNLDRARKQGVNTPYVLKVSYQDKKIYMQYLKGYEPCKEYFRKFTHIDQCSATKCAFTPWIFLKLIGDQLLGLIGEAIGKLHAGGIMHGDLTTSNILTKANIDGTNLDNNGLYLIDFGLSYISSNLEDKAVDLFVLGKRVLVLTKNRKNIHLQSFVFGREIPSGAGRL
jgi:TP53 regulating kinase-like protein